MSELQESIIRSQVILMFERNYGKRNIANRVLKRFRQCIKKR